MEDSKAQFTRKKRLASLDTLRGLTVFMMIFVDQIGTTWPAIDHCPWDGIHLADFVMPYFNFMVGVGVSFSMRKFIKTNNRKQGLKKSTIRFLKLFFIGMFTQGGIDIADYDMKHIRIMGILQRVAFCYGFAILIELFIPPKHKPMQVFPEIGDNPKHSPNIQDNPKQESLLPKEKHIINPNANTEKLSTSFTLFWIYRYQWLATLCMLGLWIAIMYGINVPNQYGEICGRGKLTPACNAQGYVDKQIITWNHMYFPSNGGEYNTNDIYSNDITFQRTHHCSSCTPGKCLRNDAPQWCFHAAFDPEGLVSSITCVLSPIFGMHCGHLFQTYKDHRVRQLHFVIVGFIECLIGLILHLSGVSVFNTDLYSPSYLLFTAGSATLTLILLYYIMDMKIGIYREIRIRRDNDISEAGLSDYQSYIRKCFWTLCDYIIFYPLECVGRNALGIYILAEAGIVNWVFEIFYWNIKKNSLANIFWPTGEIWGPSDENAAKHPWLYSPTMMIWVLAYCIFWTLCAVYFHKHKMYWVV